MPWLGIGDPSRVGTRKEAKAGRTKLNAAIAADRVRPNHETVGSRKGKGKRFVMFAKVGC